MVIGWFFTDFVYFMWISHSRWLPGPKIYILNGWNLKKKSSLKAHGRITCYIVGIFLRWSTASFVFFMQIWNSTQKRIVLRTRSGNACINDMSHYLDAQIQACTNEDPSVSGVRTLRSKVCIGYNGTKTHVSSRTINGNVIVFDNTISWFWCEDSSFSFKFRVRGYGITCHFQQYFSYIVVVSFIGGGNWRKSPTNFITKSNEYISPRTRFELSTSVVHRYQI